MSFLFCRCAPRVALFCTRRLHIQHAFVRAGIQVSCVNSSPNSMNSAIIVPTPQDIVMAQRSYGDANSAAYCSFLAGRCALRHAIAAAHDLNIPHIPRNIYGVPLVPMQASISHKNEFAVGATLIDVSPNTSLGIDIELKLRPYNTKHLASFQSHILTSNELLAVTHLRLLSPLAASLLIFSLKEAVYKAVFPHYQNYIGFREVEIQLNIEEEGRGSATVLFVSNVRRYFRGTFEVHWEELFDDYWLSIVKYNE